MAGQLQIKDRDNTTILKNYSDELRCQVKNLYLKEHFALDIKYNETDTIKAYLMKEMYTAQNCEVEDFKNEMRCCKEVKEVILNKVDPCC